MKPLSLLTLIMLLVLPVSYSQNWIPKGKDLLPSGYAVMSMSLVGDSIIWMTASSFAVVYAQEPVPLSHLIRVYRSVDAGESWESFTVVESIGRFSFDIVGISADTAWITTQDYGSGRGRALMKTEDGGESWKQKFLHRAAGVYLRAFDHQHLFCQSNEFVATSADAGTTWSIDTLTVYDKDEYNSLVSGVNMACTIGDTVWVGTTLGRIFRSKNYGTSHSMANAAPPGNFIQGVSFEDHLRGMLIYYSENFSEYGLMRTFDGGSTWEHTPDRPVTFLSSNLTHVKGSPGTYMITPDPYSPDRVYYYTTDFGVSWITGEAISGPGCNAVQFISPEIGWVSTGYFQGEGERHIGYKWNGDFITSFQNVAQPEITFEIFPNPSSDQIQYRFPQNEQMDHLQEITDLEGHILHSRKTSSNQIDITSLPDGIYLLKIKINQQTQSKLFIKAEE